MPVSTIDSAPWNPTCQGLCTSCASVSCFSSCKRSRERKWRATANLMVGAHWAWKPADMFSSQFSSNSTKWVSSCLISSYFKKETQISCKFWKQKNNIHVHQCIWGDASFCWFNSCWAAWAAEAQRRPSCSLEIRAQIMRRKMQHFCQVNKVEAQPRLLGESGMLPLAIHSSLISHCFLTRARIYITFRNTIRPSWVCFYNKITLDFQSKGFKTSGQMDL